MTIYRENDSCNLPACARAELLAILEEYEELPRAQRFEPAFVYSTYRTSGNFPVANGTTFNTCGCNRGCGCGR